VTSYALSVLPDDGPESLPSVTSDGFPIDEDEYRRPESTQSQERQAYLWHLEIPQEEEEQSEPEMIEEEDEEEKVSDVLTGSKYPEEFAEASVST